MTEDALRKVLSDAIRTATRSTNDDDDDNDPFITHITKIQSNARNDRYAFIQLATPQLATACLQLNGLVALPQNLRLTIERPRDYTPPNNNKDDDRTEAEMIDFDISQLNVLLPPSPQGKKKGKGRRGKGARTNAKTT